MACQQSRPRLVPASSADAVSLLHVLRGRCTMRLRFRREKLALLQRRRIAPIPPAGRLRRLRAPKARSGWRIPVRRMSRVRRIRGRRRNVRTSRSRRPPKKRIAGRDGNREQSAVTSRPGLMHQVLAAFFFERRTESRFPNLKPIPGTLYFRLRKIAGPRFNSLCQTTYSFLNDSKMSLLCKEMFFGPEFV
jgi:hypothetical protein